MSCILSVFVLHFVSRGFSHIKHYSLKSTELIIVTTWNFIAFNKHLDGQFCWKSFARKACFILGSLFELMLLSKKKVKNSKVKSFILFYYTTTTTRAYWYTGKTSASSCFCQDPVYRTSWIFSTKWSTKILNGKLHFCALKGSLRSIKELRDYITII